MSGHVLHVTPAGSPAYTAAVYVFPELLDGISPELRKRMQGKSCFNFTRVDDVLMTELAALAERGLQRYREMKGLASV